MGHDNDGHDAKVALLEKQVGERDGKLAQLDELLHDSNQLLREANTVTLHLSEDGECLKRNVALLESQVKERDGKLTELEELVQIEINESDTIIQEKVAKIGALQEQLESSLEATKELEDVIRASKDEIEKASSQMKEL